jgi:hypothetical protein
MSANPARINRDHEAKNIQNTVMDAAPYGRERANSMGKPGTTTGTTAAAMSRTAMIAGMMRNNQRLKVLPPGSLPVNCRANCMNATGMMAIATFSMMVPKVTRDVVVLQYMAAVLHDQSAAAVRMMTSGIAPIVDARVLQKISANSDVMAPASTSNRTIGTLSQTISQSSPSFFY